MAGREAVPDRLAVEMNGLDPAMLEHLRHQS